ncbi:uncharacterized protein K452DRAFT_296822 [Aplosporella prunicola CBS 121167]|uniref:Uncharacterized protein n=1 Tax=Aplosporella prunicola CBS 121167 TaxID=1176127 RepID=A0A6A6BI72_9PEZI|nr:uncharacterized protein K452DRAFT_296822 [Aplosporella prunicola CBS 121167]KAF2143849.1 hypothetical protein K452DRAFT_296822 [Aplosporella prunicola CBS 121167]
MPRPRASLSGLNAFGQVDWDDAFKVEVKAPCSEDVAAKEQYGSNTAATASTASTTPSPLQPRSSSPTTPPQPSSQGQALLAWATTPNIRTPRAALITTVLRSSAEDASPGQLRAACCCLRAEAWVRGMLDLGYVPGTCTAGPATCTAAGEEKPNQQGAFPPGATGTLRPLPGLPRGAKGFSVEGGVRVFRPVGSGLGRGVVVVGEEGEDVEENDADNEDDRDNEDDKEEENDTPSTTTADRSTDIVPTSKRENHDKCVVKEKEVDREDSVSSVSSSSGDDERAGLHATTITATTSSSTSSEINACIEEESSMKNE